MPDERPTIGEAEDAVPGISGGPGPAPPGVEDGTPPVRPAAPESPVPVDADEQKRAGETRKADVEEAAGRADPEEPDPS